MFTYDSGSLEYCCVKSKLLKGKNKTSIIQFNVVHVCIQVYWTYRNISQNKQTRPLETILSISFTDKSHHKRTLLPNACAFMHIF